jgi:hypothetical protein
VPSCIDDLECLGRISFPARSSALSNQEFNLNLRIRVHGRNDRFPVFSANDDVIAQMNHDLKPSGETVL